MHIAGF